MPVTYVNRQETTYYLHTGKTRKGNARYWFAKSAEGDLAEAIPEGYEVYENPDAQVFLRKIVPQKVTPSELAVVTKGLEQYAAGERCLVDVQGEHIVVYHAEKTEFDLRHSPFAFREPVYFGRYIKVLQFILDDEVKRIFRVQRWCFRGSIDDWLDLSSRRCEGKLPDLVKTYGPHIGKESFFELM
jgi:hypothetical protein